MDPAKKETTATAKRSIRGISEEEFPLCLPRKVVIEVMIMLSGYYFEAWRESKKIILGRGKCQCWGRLIYFMESMLECCLWSSLDD
jgi:hypothetical protein